jgi:hypothetical protein
MTLAESSQAGAAHHFGDRRRVLVGALDAAGFAIMKKLLWMLTAGLRAVAASPEQVT